MEDLFKEENKVPLQIFPERNFIFICIHSILRLDRKALFHYFSIPCRYITNRLQCGIVPRNVP